MRRKVAKSVQFTKEHENAGWIQCMKWHWQMKLPNGTLNYWPTRDKFMFDGKVMLGSFEAIMQFIAEEIAARPDPISHVTTERWPDACQKCGHGLFWRREQDQFWTCGNCEKFIGRGLDIRWLTTPAFATMLEQLAETSEPAK